MKQFLKNNLLFICFIVFSILLESVSLLIITGSLLIKSPLLSFLIFLFLGTIYNLISNIKTKKIFLTVFSSLHLLINLFCVILFESTGTLFDFSMLQLASETTQFIDAISINYFFIIFSALLFVIYIVASSYLTKYMDTYYKIPYQTLMCCILLFVSLISQISIIAYTNYISEERFLNTLYEDSNDNYSNLGISANFVNEISKMIFFNNYDQLSYEEIENYIYEEINTKSEYFGISKNNNLVTILVESFEWFSFISDPSVYPNGMNLNNEKLDALFPNLRNFYNESIVMNNHYAQNKTDISEDEALLGVYPNSAYINYNFSDTVSPSSIANLLKLQDENISNNFFHANEKNYYNRGQVVSSIGYENLYFLEDMQEKGLHNYIEGDSSCVNCMNLDSHTVELMKDEMFPTNSRFNTHFTTISMHGNYTQRRNMQRWHDKLEQLGVTIDNYYLKNYLAAVMEFDHALGLIIEDLTQKDLLSTTTIVLFSDHNTYLSNLTYQVKDIQLNDYSNENYINLYKVPLMIYDDNIGHKVIDKFTTTYDITPTILDLFGINYYSNLYYGNSIFNAEESILYSKAYNIFIANGLLYSNINNILYKDKNISTDYIKEIENKSLKLLKKIYYINHIYEYNFFKNPNNYENYLTKVQAIN